MYLARATWMPLPSGKFFATLFFGAILLLMKSASILFILTVLLSTKVTAQKRSVELLEKLATQAYKSYLSNPDTALALTKQVLDNALVSKNTFYEGRAYFLFAKAHWVKANYRLSTEYGFKALRIFRDSPHCQELAATFLCLGRNLVELGNFDQARQFIGQALQLGITHSDDRILAAAYREQSFLMAEVDKPDSTLYYADKSLDLYQKLGDSLNISVLYGRKSRIFFQQQKYEASKDFAYRGLIIDSLIGNKRGLGISYFQAAQNEHALGNIDKAIAQLKYSVRINDEIKNLNWQIRSYELLATLHLKKKQPALAALEFQKASRYKDDLYNSEKNAQIQEMSSLHEMEIKDNTIILLERKNLLKQQQVSNQKLFVAFLLATVLFLTLLIFVLARLRRIQKRTNGELASRNFEIEQQRLAIQTQAENLQQLDQLKTKLFSVISHDLRAPILNVQALLDMFTQDLMTAEEFISLSHTLKENLNLTQRTLENLLNWSLSQMGGIKTDRKKIEVNACIGEACCLMEAVAARKKITFKKDFDGSMMVSADADQLQVVLRNLIQNAIKFSSFNEQIVIKSFVNNNQCQISVKDSGIGMSREEIDTIISSKQFFSKNGTEKEKGTGLGLLLCKEFISRNGGQFFIKSALGEGTEVSFTLQLAEREDTLVTTG